MPNEREHSTRKGAHEGKNGLVVLTDRRVLFTEQSAFRNRIEDFPYEKISSVQTQTAIMSGKLTIYASGNKALIKDVMPKERVPEIGDFIRSRIGASPTSEPAGDTSTPQGPASDAALDQLTKLGELRDAGVVTDEEFETKKKELLSRL